MLHLSCYSPNDLVAVGEKYGFHATSSHGYDYITGGGGMIFSKELVKHLADPRICHCPSIDTPDDMLLGLCLKHLTVPIIHSRLFHQGRPADYPQKLLQYEQPVSFHKFWMVDPLDVYAKWLERPDINDHVEL
ncbi:Transferase activity protein, partial [Halocaridina rubra]